MTAKNKKISPMLHSWRWNVKANIKIMIILTVLHMAAAPAVFLSVIIDLLSHKYADPDVYIGIGTVTTIAAGFMGIIIGVNSFNCLHKKSVVDMKLSLPMTADQRFVSDFLSGLFVYIAPFLAAQAVSFILAGVGNLIVYLIRNDASSQYVPVNSVYRPYFPEYYADAIISLLKLVICVLLVMLMLYTLTVLITVCCGSKFECIAYSIVINAVIPLTILMVTMSMFNDIFGIDPEYNAIRTFMVTSPAGGIFTAVLWAFEDDYIMDYMHPAIWAGLFFLLTVLIGVLVFFLYRRRRAEQVSKPFVFKLVYYIIITGVIFCICSGFFMASSFVPAFIITAVVYMIAESVTNRGFKNFRRSVIKYAATVAAAFLIIIVGHETDGFGALSRVPASLTVASVRVNYGGIYNDFNFDYSGGIVLRDRENIKSVIAAHKTILEQYEEYMSLPADSRREYYSGVRNQYILTIKYRLVGGGVIERSYYNVLTPEVAEILSSVDYTDEYKKRLAEYYTEEIHLWKEQYVGLMEEPEYYDKYYRYYDARLTRYARSGNNIAKDYSEMPMPYLYERNFFSEMPMLYLYERNFFDRFAEAYVRDIMAIDRSNYALSDNITNYYTVYRFKDRFVDLRIPLTFENTLRLLEEYGFEIP